MIAKNSKILITWATGFVGSNLLRGLCDLWYLDIHIIIRGQSNAWRIQDILLKSCVSIHYGDLVDRETIDTIVQAVVPDYIFHLAVGGARIWRDNLHENDVLVQNILWTKNLLDSCIRLWWWKAFINTGSSSEYGEKSNAIAETDLLEPNNIYGVSKAAISMYCQMQWKQKNLPIYNYRIFWAYGPYEDKERLIAYLCLSYCQNKEILLSSPSSVRDFIFIDDIIKYYLHCDSIQGRYGESFNIGTGIQHTIQETVNIIKSLAKSDKDPNYNIVQKKQHEPLYRYANMQKTESIFLFQPRSLRLWLEKTFERYKNNQSLYI